MGKVPQHFYRQSAVLPYRRHQGRLQILLVTSRKKKRWVLPKGVQEPGLEAGDSALKEALEEAGVEGDLEPQPVGEYRYPKWEGICRVLVFPMSVHTIHASWPESYRDREWMTPDEAARRVDEPALKEMIREFAEREPEVGPS